MPIIAVMWHDAALLAKVRTALTRELGAVADELSYPFSHSSYYDAEMGSGLTKTLWAFSRSIERERIVDMKLSAVKLEKKYAVNGKRRVNIDPGLLTPENFILATGKNFTHRVYLGRGVFADLTLTYRKGEGYCALPWTYRDYQLKEVTTFLEKNRPRNTDSNSMLMMEKAKKAKIDK